MIWILILLYTIPLSRKIITKTFYTKKLDKLNPRYHEFEVPEGYKFLKSRTWWASLSVGRGSASGLPIKINVTIPASEDIFVAPPTDDEKWKIIWNFASSVANFAEKTAKNDLALESVYQHELVRKAEKLREALFDFISEELERL